MAITIKCHGEYYYKNQASKGVKPFKSLDVRVPSMESFRETNERYMGTDDDGKAIFKTNTFLNVRGMLKKVLLPAIMKRRPGFEELVRVRGVVIEEVLGDTPQEVSELPVTLMSSHQIASLILAKKMPIDSTEYVDIDVLRKDVMEYQDNPEAFIRNKARREKTRKLDKEFMELNNLLEEPVAPIAPIAKKNKPSIQDL
jgi:hypothetical protein